MFPSICAGLARAEEPPFPCPAAKPIHVLDVVAVHVAPRRASVPAHVGGCGVMWEEGAIWHGTKQIPRGGILTRTRLLQRTTTHHMWEGDAWYVNQGDMVQKEWRCTIATEED